MTQTPSSTDGGQAPTSGLPQAGTPTIDGQAPVSQTAPTEHERIIEQLRKENASHRADLKKYKDDEAARAQAQMSELEKAQKQAADLQEQQEALAAELFEARVRQDVADKISKFNFIPSARTIANLLLADDDAIEFEDGRPTNIEKLLGDLAKREPDLVKPAQAQQQQPGTPTIPAMNPGRSSITQPGQQPGRIPRLSDRDLWKR